MGVMSMCAMSMERDVDGTRIARIRHGFKRIFSERDVDGTRIAQIRHGFKRIFPSVMSKDRDVDIIHLPDDGHSINTYQPARNPETRNLETK